MMCFGNKRIDDLEKAMLLQGEEIKTLRAQLNNRTMARGYYDICKDKNLSVSKAIDIICGHLGIYFDYVSPNEVQTGWQLCATEDDPNK